MLLLVEVVVEGQDRPPAGAPLRLEVRDTTMEDTEAPLIAETRSAVSGEQTSWLVELEVPDESIDPRGRLTAFAHIDVDGDGAMSPGDFITTRSYPVPHEAAGAESQIQVAVTRI